MIKDNKGFTLIEGMVVFSVAMMGMMGSMKISDLVNRGGRKIRDISTSSAVFNNYDQAFGNQTICTATLNGKTIPAIGTEAVFIGAVKNNERDIFKIGDKFGDGELEVKEYRIRNESVAGAGTTGEVSFKVILKRLGKNVAYTDIQREFRILVAADAVSPPLAVSKCATIYDGFTTTTLQENCSSLGAVYDAGSGKCDFSGAGADNQAAATTKMINDGNFATDLVNRLEDSTITGDLDIVPTPPAIESYIMAPSFCLTPPNDTKCLIPIDSDCGNDGYVKEFNVFGGLTDGNSTCKKNLNCGNGMIAGFDVTGEPICKTVGTADPLDPCPTGKSNQMGPNGEIICLPGDDIAVVNSNCGFPQYEYPKFNNLNMPPGALDIMCDDDMYDWLKGKDFYVPGSGAASPMFFHSYRSLNAAEPKLKDFQAGFLSFSNYNAQAATLGCHTRAIYDSTVATRSFGCYGFEHRIYGYTCGGKPGETNVTFDSVQYHVRSVQCTRNSGGNGVRVEVYCCPKNMYSP